MSNRTSALWLGGGALFALAVLAVALAFAQRMPKGPVPIAYDHEACHHCHMQIGDPRFAAQAQLEDGQVLDFDDPGCLLAWRRQRHAPIRTLWFHDLHDERWLRGDAVGFVPAGQTPMGFGLGAVNRTVPGAVGLEEASERIARQADARREADHAAR
jgi:hypothetical protein